MSEGLRILHLEDSDVDGEFVKLLDTVGRVLRQEDRR